MYYGRQLFTVLLLLQGLNLKKKKIQLKFIKGNKFRSLRFID